MAPKTLFYPRLTGRRYELLLLIQEFWGTHGYAPSARDLTALLGLASVSTTHTHLEKLRDQGMIEWEVGRPRTMRLTRQGKNALIEQRVL